MARPESISDIEVKDIDFASVDVNDIASDGSLVKAYGTFMEAVQKAGATVEVNYSTARFSRPANQKEREAQLRQAQASWDDGKKQYETLAAVGECEYAWQRGQAQKWAEGEGIPFPPEHEPMSDFDAVIHGIDSVVAE